MSLSLPALQPTNHVSPPAISPMRPLNAVYSWTGLLLNGLNNTSCPKRTSHVSLSVTILGVFAYFTSPERCTN